MKIVLSRKSMDSSYGGMPSPIIRMKDGTTKMFPLPIPIGQDQSSTKYAEVNLFDDYTAWDFINTNKPNFQKIYGEYCHLDPDLSKSTLCNRNQNWEVGFGQDHIAQSHLAKHKVNEGDIFLFFGWFQYAEFIEGNYKFIKNDEFPDGFHSIYAYLQIKESHIIKEKKYPESLKEHPHAKFHDNFKTHSQNNNTIYTAKESLTIGGNVLQVKGSGYIEFNEKLLLTKRGQKYRSVWDLPLHFHPSYGVEITYNAANKWKQENERAILQSAYRGQEFVCTNDPNNEVEKWFLDFLK